MFDYDETEDIDDSMITVTRDIVEEVLEWHQPHAVSDGNFFYASCECGFTSSGVLINPIDYSDARRRARRLAWRHIWQEMKKALDEATEGPESAG